LIVFSRDSGFVFVVNDLTFQIAWKLIDTIVSIIFISDPESFLFVFIIAEAGKCTIDIISSSCIYVSWLVIVLPCVVSFLLVLNFSVMRNFRFDLCFLFYVSLWEVLFITLILFIQSLLVNIRILQIIIFVTFCSQTVMKEITIKLFIFVIVL
jgi:hypothetical protein